MLKKTKYEGFLLIVAKNNSQQAYDVYVRWRINYFLIHNRIHDIYRGDTYCL